jgi:diadenylate cyclase
MSTAVAWRFAADAHLRVPLRDHSGSADTVPFRPVEIGGAAGIVTAASTVTSARRAPAFARGPQPEDLPVPPASRSEAMLSALRLVAPGRPLREGLDRILQAKMGALIVIGDGPDVLSLCSGGFLLDAEFTPQRLSELAKMDGAMILSADCTRIARANVHLVPDPEIPTSETGTRHRTAERVAKQIDAPVLTVSEELSLVAVHRKGQKRTLEPVARVLTRADQALQILERYKTRLDAVSNSLSALEIEDLVTVRDIAVALQRAEMVRRIAEEIEEYVIELGQDGRLILLQLEELMGGVEDDRRLFAKDYVVAGNGSDATAALGVLADLDTESLLDVREVADVLHLPRDTGLDTAVQARGYRLLHKIPRLPEPVADNVVARFGQLQKILRASVPDLVEVEGVGESRARAIKDGLARLAESSILERYV